MRADALAELCAIMRGVPPRTRGTPGSLNSAPAQKCPSFHVFQAFQVEHDTKWMNHIEAGTWTATWLQPDDIAEAERAAVAIELGCVPPAYADAWAAFQTRESNHSSEGDWRQAVNDAGHFLDDWALLALDFGWQPLDIFGPDGIAWFCAGERVRALGPDNAITGSGRIFTRRASGSE
jgi:hypothetical protein